VSNFRSERHALYTGMILGLAMRHGVALAPTIDAAGDYTSELALELGKITVTLKVPEPPPDWDPEEWLAEYGPA
jgi:hypothetical protein